MSRKKRKRLTEHGHIHHSGESMDGVTDVYMKNALEEIQVYRAIGLTLESAQEINRIDDEILGVLKSFDELGRYRAIGTVEECKENKAFLEFLYDRILPNEMEQYLAMYHAENITVTN